MRIVSWNVNGLRSVHGKVIDRREGAASKDFLGWLGASGDVIGLQETRIGDAQLPTELRSPHGLSLHLVAAERAGYSGVALYSRRVPDAIETGLGVGTFDVEGRVQIARFGALTVANVYFPNGSGQERDNSRVPYKLRFYKKLFSRLEPAFRAGEPIVVMGDFNTAPHPIDLARPKENEKTSGFLPEERRELVRWFEAGYVDSYRHFDPSEGRYTWWSQRFGVRERNVGWRIDLALVSPGAMPYLKSATIHHDHFGSDHCPIAIELDDAVLAHTPMALPPAKPARRRATPRPGEPKVG